MNNRANDRTQQETAQIIAILCHAISYLETARAIIVRTEEKSTDRDTVRDLLAGTRAICEVTASHLDIDINQ